MRTADRRLGSGKFLRNQLNKVFPDHWSFMLGELALYSFIVLLVTGTFMSFFFHPSQHDVIYGGAYKPLDGMHASEAYVSVLDLSFNVRAGLLMRQVHHWAALVFIGSILVHMCRIYFTGAFRKPREVNWVIGTTLLIVAIVEGFCGYSLPDDLLSGTGVRIAYSIIESIPIIGSYLATFIFQGQFPGHDAIIPRFFILHIMILPAILLGLIAAHLMIVWHQKHTQFPEPGRREDNVVGSTMWPSYSLKGQGLFFIVFGVLFALGAFVQINPIWLYGPYDPSQGSFDSQPDWYMLWLEGSLRLMTRVETHFLGHTIAWDVFLPAVVLPVVLFAVIYAYPFVERLLTHDHESHELLQYPSTTPHRTATGMAVLMFYGILTAAGGNGVIAKTFHMDLTDLTWALRGMIIVFPPVTFWVTRRICFRIQRLHEAPIEEVPRSHVMLSEDRGYVVDTGPDG